MFEPNALERFEINAAELVMSHPPRLEGRHKQDVFAIACPQPSALRGTIRYSRWSPLPLDGDPAADRAAATVSVQPGHFVYPDSPHDGDVVHWHVNFADPHLFVAYGSSLLAQDELQAAEHPALGSIREMLLARGAPALTVADGRPTPVLVRGVERHCRIDTAPNAAEGRPFGLYGNRFATASIDDVRMATHLIAPPTITNLIAMSAPLPGFGPYTRDQIMEVLVTARTGFTAAVRESGARPAIVHTGFWGCGAFGGNRQLMTMLQAVAAASSGVDRLLFYAFDEAGIAEANAGLRTLQQRFADGRPSFEALIGEVCDMGYQWGVSDGN